MNLKALTDLLSGKERFRYERSFYFLLLCLLLHLPAFSLEKKVFVTATDTEHYQWTLNLVSGIHRHHSENTEIAIFDIGLAKEEKKELQKLLFVKIYEVEKVNPQIFEKFIVNKQGKIARGLYSWKPVVIKQASSLFPYFFYLDSGISITGPLDILFDYIEESGSFFIDCGHDIGRMATQHVRHLFRLDEKQNAWVLNESGISAGFQGITRSLYSSYIYPTYQMSYDLSNFCDDGSCPKGFGWARHDQTLFSIQARLNRLPVYKAVRGESFILSIAGKKKKVQLNEFIKITRNNFDLEEAKGHLRYK